MTETALEWIHSFDRFNGLGGIKPGLERMEAMLERLGRPHDRLKFLHVAGTNGKGSTCKYLATILERAGYKVGLYTSPYMTDFYDRMAVAGSNITAAALEEWVARLKPIVEEVSASACGRPTEFEVVTTLAIMHYAEEQVDFVVWETGLGGRLDSTNVVKPVLSLITNVGHDHQAILGDTIEQIAAEKAGIIKPGIPVLTTAQGAALAVIEQTAQVKSSPCYRYGRDFSAERTSADLCGQTFDWQGFGTTLPELRLAMLGAHQIDNAALAVAAIQQLRALNYSISEEALRQGLAEAMWAGRLEAVSQEPLILLDGAHNPEGAQALARFLREQLAGRRLVLAVGILADKAIPEVLAPLLPFASHCIVMSPDLPRAAKPEAVAAVIRQLAPGLPVETASTVPEGLALGQQQLQAKSDCLVITGSLYTISEARALLVKRES